jgi:hypothetical protein
LRFSWQSIICRKGKEVTATEAEQETAAASLRLLPTYMAGFHLPEGRRYHQGHTWALQESRPGDVAQQAEALWVERSAATAEAL